MNRLPKRETGSSPPPTENVSFREADRIPLGRRCSIRRRALAEGTQDARLFYHAGAIAAAAGDKSKALEFLNKAHAIEKMLLPPERQALSSQTATLLATQPQLSSK